MAKGAYIGVSGVARKIKKGYIGVDGVARKIKKAYIGIGGVARPCWSGGELAYYGTLTALSVKSYSLAASGNSRYAIFGGGCYSGKITRADVYAYDTSLTKTTPASNLSQNRQMLAATTNNDYVIFGGGTYKAGSGYPSATVDAYDASLTRSTPTGLSASRMRISATAIGDYALFAGGHGSSGYYATVDAYDSLLARSVATSLSNKTIVPVGASTNKHGIFAGGENISAVDAYDSSMTKSVATSLDNAMYYGAGASFGKYALFTGGRSGTTTTTSFSVYSAAYAYDENLTKHVITSLDVGKYEHCGVGHEEFAVFAGGRIASNGMSASIEAYDQSLTKQTCSNNLSLERCLMGGAVIDNYIIFGGGYMNNAKTNVDACVIT